MPRFHLRQLYCYLFLILKEGKKVIMILALCIEKMIYVRPLAKHLIYINLLK